MILVNNVITLFINVDSISSGILSESVGNSKCLSVNTHSLKLVTCFGIWQNYVRGLTILNGILLSISRYGSSFVNIRSHIEILGELLTDSLLSLHHHDWHNGSTRNFLRLFLLFIVAGDFYGVSSDSILQVGHNLSLIIYLWEQNLIICLDNIFKLFCLLLNHFFNFYWLLILRFLKVSNLLGMGVLSLFASIDLLLLRSYHQILISWLYNLFLNLKSLFAHYLINFFSLSYYRAFLRSSQFFNSSKLIKQVGNFIVIMLF